MFTEVFTSLVILLLISIYYVAQRKFDYWKKRKVPHLKPVPFLGNYGPYITMRKYLGFVTKELCEKFPNVPYFGAFYGTEPALVVKDPEIVKLVMTKDNYYFSGREISAYSHKEALNNNLVFTYGDRWRVLRQNLSPLFSSAKMKNMFYLIEKCCHEFEEMIDYRIKNNNELEVRSLLISFTMDSIGSCAFGVDTGTMAKNSENNPFTKLGKLIFAESYIRGVMVVTRSIWPSIFYGIGLKSFPKKVDDFFNKLMTDVFSQRQYKSTDRNDFVDMILKWKTNNCIIGDSIENLKTGNNRKVSLEVDDELLVSQSIVFFTGGFETSSTSLQFLLYELAKNPKAQKRVTDEIDEYLRRHNNKLGYECITELPFTEACINESFRLNPIVPVITREVTADYTLPCGAVVEKGLRVHIPLYYLHHNPDFFPDPEVFRPERFYGEEKQNIKPQTFLPFGDGPRLCIGKRFAKMQMHACLITLLKKYRLEPCEDTPKKMDYTPTTIVTQPSKPIKLKFVEREGWEQRQLSS